MSGTGAATQAHALASRSDRPRRRGLPVLAATLRQSRSLMGAACFYVFVIGLLIGLIFPALTALDLRSYISNGTVGSLIGVSKLTSSTFSAYLAVELYGSFFLLLFGGVLAYAAGASIARNIEDGTIDLDLARPVSRTRLYVEKWVAMLVGLMMILAVSVFTAWLDTRLFSGASLDWQWFLLGHLDLASMLFFVVGVGLLFSAALSGGRAAGGAATLVVVFGYLAQTFGTASDRLSLLKYLSPYYYAPAAQVIISRQWSGTGKFLVPVAVGLIAALAGLFIFRRRDITP
jgi:ABC-2 type transport system permease protein